MNFKANASLRNSFVVFVGGQTGTEFPLQLPVSILSGVVILLVVSLVAVVYKR